MKKQTIETNLLLNLSIYAPKWWDFNLPSTSQKINAAINAEQNTIGNFGKETKENDLLNQSLNTGDRQTVICKFAFQDDQKKHQMHLKDLIALQANQAKHLKLHHLYFS